MGKLRRHETTGNASAQSTDSQVLSFETLSQGQKKQTHKIPLHSNRLVGRYATKGKPTLKDSFSSLLLYSGNSLAECSRVVRASIREERTNEIYR